MFDTSIQQGLNRIRGIQGNGGGGNNDSSILDIAGGGGHTSKPSMASGVDDGMTDVSGEGGSIRS